MSEEPLAEAPKPEEPKPEEAVPAKPACRCEYVVIFQRKLKGLDRRLVGTRAYLPVGFKMADFKHLSAGSFVFCTGCRRRLFPKRTQAEKEAARLERKRAKEAELERLRLEEGIGTSSDGIIDKEKLEILAKPASSSGGGLGWTTKAAGNVSVNDDDDDIDDDEEVEETEIEETDPDEEGVNISVDELEVESVDVEDIKAEGVKLTAEDDDSACDMDTDGGD